MKKFIGMALAVCAVAGSAQAQNVLVNGGFEEKCTVASGWNSFGNVQNINYYTTSGAHSIKMWGPFNANPGYSGAYQSVPASPGQQWKASGNVFSPCWDRLQATGTKAFVEITFFDAANNRLTEYQQYISPKQEESTITGGNAACTDPAPEPLPVLLETDYATAPAGTVRVEIQLLVEQLNNVGGAAWWDDAMLERADAPGENQLSNSSFESFTANCLGSAFVGWVNFGNGGDNPGVNQRTGDNAAKLWGGYNGAPAYSGWFQDVPASAGTSWVARGWGRSASNDSLQVGNNVYLQVEFYDEFNNNLVGAAALSDSIPTPGDDTYRFYETGVAVAPPDTVKARLVIIQIQSNYQGGATWWDDIEFGPACQADFNGDQFIDFFDYDDYVNCFESGNCPPGRTADFNGDQFVDFFDYDDFVSAFETGC